MLVKSQPMYIFIGGARDIMVIAVENGHVDSSSKPGCGCSYFTVIHTENVLTQLFFLQL